MTNIISEPKPEIKKGTAKVSREIRLVSRPKGLPAAENFSLATINVEPPRSGEVLVRNLFMSVDPYMRGRMREAGNYEPFQPGQPLDGRAVGEVVESRADGIAPGAAVTSEYGWREYFTAPANKVRTVPRTVQPLSVYLGALGMPGMTAWAGLKLAELKAGEVVYISAAAGAVGSVAGQLARLRGYRVIGSARSAQKVGFLLKDLEFDKAFNYTEGPVAAQLAKAAPDGIDVYFDNVGGEALEAALSCLRPHGRIIACGGISGYNDEAPRPGPRNLFNMVSKRLTMTGLFVGDWLNKRAEFEKEMRGYLQDGKLRNYETVVEGLEKAPEAFIGLFNGRNTGKMIVKL